MMVTSRSDASMSKSPCVSTKKRATCKFVKCTLAILPTAFKEKLLRNYCNLSLPRLVFIFQQKTFVFLLNILQRFLLAAIFVVLVSPLACTCNLGKLQYNTFFCFSKDHIIQCNYNIRFSNSILELAKLAVLCPWERHSTLIFHAGKQTNETI